MKLEPTSLRDGQTWSTGGLIHISDTIFLFFVALEVVVKPHFSTKNLSLLQKGLKERVIGDVVQDNDVLFHWSMIASNWVEEDADELLKTIVNHWVTMRGFSFVSGFNERYKKEQKKTLEKSKGTRKYLIGESEILALTLSISCMIL